MCVAVELPVCEFVTENKSYISHKDVLFQSIILWWLNCWSLYVFIVFNSTLMSLSRVFVNVEMKFALDLILICLSPYSEPEQPGRVSVLKMFLYIVIK